MPTFTPNYEQNVDAFSMSKKRLKTANLPVYNSLGVNPSD